MSVLRDDELRVFADVDFSPLDSADSAYARRIDTPLSPLIEIPIMAFLLASGSVVLFTVIGLFAVPESARPAISVWGAVAVAILAGGIWFFRWWGERHGRVLPNVVFELPKFAQRNRFTYRVKSVVDDTLPPAAGQEQHIQRVSRRLRPAEGSGWPEFEIGFRIFHREVTDDFEPTEKRPYPITLSEGWYVAIPLPQRLPHIALLRREDRPASMLDQEAQYSMGVEFDQTFTLLCPPGYERDALYLFTPDVLAAMLDDAGSARFGAEVLDNYLFFRFPVDTADGALFAEDVRRALLLVERTSTELAKQASRYRDERSEARDDDTGLRLIAPPGRRVRTRVRPTMVAVGLGLPLMVIAPFVMLMTARMG